MITEVVAYELELAGHRAAAAVPGVEYANWDRIDPRRLMCRYRTDTAQALDGIRNQSRTSCPNWLIAVVVTGPVAHQAAMLLLVQLWPLCACPDRSRRTERREPGTQRCKRDAYLPEIEWQRMYIGGCCDVVS